MVAWGVMCMPKWAGDFRIPNLRWLNFALRARWLWLNRVDGSKPSVEFNIQVPSESHTVYKDAVFVDVGDGRTSLFWECRWL